MENSYLPHREEVLDIISTKKWGERKSALWKVGDGEVWDILMDEFFPLMRGIRVAVFCLKNENDEDSVEEIQEEADVLPFSPVDEKEFPVIQVDTVYVTDTVYIFKEVPVAKNARSLWLMGLKTNILTDAVAVPSFGLELQLAERLSLDLQGWYGFHNILYRSAQTDIYGFSPELRWWFADRAMEKGHFIGVSGVCSWYTLEWLDGYLYQNGLEEDFCIGAGNSSPAWSAGLVYGYSLGLGRKARWGLEFTLGFGYASYSQNVGEWNEDAASWLYHSHQNNHHIGITELSVNLTYRFSLRKFDPAYYDAPLGCKKLHFFVSLQAYSISIKFFNLKMRQLRFLPAFLMLLLSACSDRFSDSRPDCPEGGTGDVVITLDADIRNENINVKSASGEEIPVDDFWVEIFNSKSKRLYCEKYAEAKDDVINLNTGDYRLLAKHGDSLGVGFDKPFYMADVAFAVEARKDNSVSAVAKLANVKVKVIFGENLSNTEFYGDCFAIVRNSDRKVKSELKFRKDETRAGYIPAGELILEVYAKIGDSYKYYPVEAKSYSPNDFVTFEIDADVRSGDVTVALTIDDSVEVLEKTVVIPADSALPAAEPVMSMDGFDNEGAVYMSSGTAPKIDELDIDINAPAELSSLMLEINSDCLASGGVPSTVDLLNPGTALTALKKAGFVWYVTTSSTVAVVDFKSVAA